MGEVTLYLMSNKGFTVLESIIKNNLQYLISRVVYGTDKNVLNDYSKEIQSLCKKNNIEYYLRGNVPVIDSEYIIAISWRWLIKNIGKHQSLIVLHDSILPKYRGFSPLVSALLNADKEIGVSALYATEDYDRGDIISQQKINVDYPIKIKDAIIKITECYIKLVLFLFEKIKANEKMGSNIQNDDEASYSLWRDEDDYEINWNWSSEYIKRFIDSVGFPYKSASTHIGSEKVRIFEAETVEDLDIINRTAGKVIRVENTKPIIVCGEGLIKIIDGKYENSEDDLLPLKKFRTKFGI